MRLARLRLENYRSCSATTIDFAEHLTLLVGENDAGKSNIIDALRTTIQPASARNSLYFELERDLSYGCSAGDAIEITRTFADLSPAEDALFTPVLVDDHRKLVHSTVYRTQPELLRRQRLGHTVSDMRIPDPEPENRDRIAQVYLPPLRDAARALDSADGNRLADVFQVLATPDEITAFEEAANRSLAELASDDLARKVVAGVQGHLTSVTQPVRHRVVDVRHSEQRLRRLARSLRLHMAAEGLTPSDLLGSGLGYANLLFVATVVLELEKASEFDLTMLLVEEPEAHLHPQLQSVLLSYLYDQAEQSASSASKDPLAPAGRIQVIATTHSPQLASAVSTANVVVIRSHERATPQVHSSPDDLEHGHAAVKVPPSEESAPPRYTQTSAVALARLPLSPLERRKVDRYLDATRSALLFARQVILVEGIAEALLLRTFAERLVYPKSKDGDQIDGPLNRRLREQFRAISILAIGGVDFMPYLKVLLGGDVNLCDRVVVVTDGDSGAGDKRNDEIAAAFAEQMSLGVLSVHVGATTLEAELYAAVSNEAVMRAAFLEQHPRSAKKWDALCPSEPIDGSDRAAVFSKALKDKDLDLGKGDFAQVIAELLDQDGPTEFTIPPYLGAALEAATIVGDDA